MYFQTPGVTGRGRRPAGNWAGGDSITLFDHEALKGERAGAYSIRVSDQWRIRFAWEAGDALNVEIVDYH